MAFHDLYNETMVAQALPSGAHTTGTANGSAIDLDQFGNNFRAALFVVQAATITDGTHTITLQDSPDGTTWTNVDANHSENAPLVLGAAQSNTVAALSYKGEGNRYVRLVATTAGATTGGVFGAVAVLAEGSDVPVSRS